MPERQKKLEVFPARRQEDAGPALNRLLAVAANAQPARLVARATERKSSGAQAYLYQFTRVPATALGRRFGAHHGVDLAYVFGNTKEADGYDEADRRLSTEVMAYWVNFARTGNPNGRGLPAWPAYRRRTDLNMELSDTVRTSRELFRKECDFVGRESIFRRRGTSG